jgi:catechol 2,3-dioxygenase-like lactoylglutathione lyase family enzyme
MDMAFSQLATGVQHIGVPTNDIAKTIAFYEKLGFVNVHEKDNNGEQVAFLKLGDLVVETYQNGKAVGSAGAVDHIAINVTDVDAARRIADEMGLEVIEAGQLPFWTNGVKYFTILGPNSEKLEFNQYL